MTVSVADKNFTGSIPALYETYLVPLIFEPYAVDLASRLMLRPVGRLLEIAAGTGVVTRRLAHLLPPTTSVIATDVNQAMLDMAASRPIARPVAWQPADAMALPFDDASFDAVVCQFGAMFFPDKVRAFSEAHRVLMPGGVFAFSVWDRIEENELAAIVTTALGAMFPDNPPRFLARTPHGYFSLADIQQDLQLAGFSGAIRVETVTARSRASDAEIPAIAYCQGTPLRSEIEAQGRPTLGEATAMCATAIRQHFNAGAVDGKMQAHVFLLTR